MNFFSTQPNDNIICPDESLSKSKEDDNYVHKLSDIYKSSPCQPKIFKSLLSQLNTSGSLCDKSQKQYIYQQLQQQVSNCNPKCKINKNLELNYRDWETLNAEYDKCQTERGLKKDKQNKKFEKVYPSEWMQKEQMDGQQEQMDGELLAENNLEKENEAIRNDFNRVRDNGTDEEQRTYGNNLLKAQQYISDQSPEAKWNMNPDKKGGKRKSLRKKSKKSIKKGKSKKSRKSKSKSKTRKSKSSKSKSRKGRSRRR